MSKSDKRAVRCGRKRKGKMARQEELLVVVDTEYRPIRCSFWLWRKKIEAIRKSEKAKA